MVLYGTISSLFQFYWVQNYQYCLLNSVDVAQKIRGAKGEMIYRVAFSTRKVLIVLLHHTFDTSLNKLWMALFECTVPTYKTLFEDIKMLFKETVL